MIAAGNDIVKENNFHPKGWSFGQSSSLIRAMIMPPAAELRLPRNEQLASGHCALAMNEM